MLVFIIINRHTHTQLKIPLLQLQVDTLIIWGLSEHDIKCTKLRIYHSFICKHTHTHTQIHEKNIKRNLPWLRKPFGRHCIKWQNTKKDIVIVLLLLNTIIEICHPLATASSPPPIHIDVILFLLIKGYWRHTCQANFRVKYYYFYILMY